VPSTDRGCADMACRVPELVLSFVHYLLMSMAMVTSGMFRGTTVEGSPRRLRVQIRMKSETITRPCSSDPARIEGHFRLVIIFTECDVHSRRRSKPIRDCPRHLGVDARHRSTLHLGLQPSRARARSDSSLSSSIPTPWQKYFPRFNKRKNFLSLIRER
jgi:hypothetical protein